MGLACSQVRLLGLTQRKADCEYKITMNSMRKMALTNEQTELSREYQSRLQNAKQISYYANGKYNKVNYQYLMGYGRDYQGLINGTYSVKQNKSMILTDYRGLVVLSSDYANAITSVIGTSKVSGGKGGTFDKKYIPKMLEEITDYDASLFEDVMANRPVTSSYSGYEYNLLTQETGEKKTYDNSDELTKQLQTLLDFYLPIFEAAATNGWTTEYNKEIMSNEDYISDALISGTFFLESADDFGQYVENSSLTYFLNSDNLQKNSCEEMRENITAWYNAERANLNEKETWLDVENKELSTELEAINTEIDAVKTLIDDAITSVFSWGSNA